MVSTVVRPTEGKDKSLHPWQQGNAIWQWIEPLTDGNDLRPIAAAMWPHSPEPQNAPTTSRFIGAEIAPAGSARIAV
jgi:hypothetical protein